MPACMSPLSSFRQVLEVGHPFIPENANAVEGQHLPGARPIHPPGNKPEMDGGALDEASGNAGAQAAGVEGPRAHANAGAGAGAAQVQVPAQHGNMANPPANPNNNVHPNAPGVEEIIKEKISALVTAFRRLFPVMIVERCQDSTVGCQLSTIQPNRIESSLYDYTDTAICMIPESCDDNGVGVGVEVDNKTEPMTTKERKRDCPARITKRYLDVWVDGGYPDFMSWIRAEYGRPLVMGAGEEEAAEE
ncbi:hypothetical protein CVT25_013578 [Psilocybe cyanescens]|uniref:Uncharacterized protein n=1 Tax=Psilocybe cyanescens TaxID=93625 RepID=A0A409XSS0_PSICY|nr:hypothetical protein CVT25_013578 [Psilocybe cyanescens]